MSYFAEVVKEFKEEISESARAGRHLLYRYVHMWRLFSGYVSVHYYGWWLLLSAAGLQFYVKIVEVKGCAENHCFERVLF